MEENIILVKVNSRYRLTGIKFYEICSHEICHFT